MIRSVMNIARGLLGAVVLLAPVSVCASQDVIRLMRNDDSLSMVDARRVVLGGDSRYATGDARQEALADGRSVELPAAGSLPIEIEIPEDLAGVDALYVEGDYGVEYQGLAGTKHIRRTPLRSRMWLKGDGRKLVLEGEVGDDDRGKTARVDVTARVVEGDVDVVRFGPVDLPSTSPRLEFAYGVEAPGWIDGAPPVRFVVSTARDPEAVLWERRIDPSEDPRERRWHEASVSLAELPGAGATFLLRAETASKGVTPARSLGVFANVVVRGGEEERARKNLILISADTLRAMSLSAYGYSRPTSPNIDRFLRKGGVMVRAALAPMPFTPASHMSMFTGLAPCAHQVMGIEDALAPEIVTLAERLRSDGYETAAFTENAFLVAGGGFDRGFDVYVENRSDELTVDGYARETFERATSWLRRNRAEPFFLFVHTYQVHDPYTPPRPFEALFGDRGEKWANLDAYEREIRFLDEILGDFFDEIERLGLMEDTILVLTSDHGEGFGEHKGSIGHSWQLWDEVVRVPLFVRADGMVPAGTVAETQVGLVDLSPTLLDLMGFGIPEDLDGQSFLGALQGDPESVAKFAERAVFLRSTPIAVEPKTGRLLSNTWAARTKRWKLLAPRRLFDLENAPFEFGSRARKYPDVAETLRSALDQHRKQCAERWKNSTGRRNLTEATPKWISDMSRTQKNRLEETRRKLESLGYVE